MDRIFNGPGSIRLMLVETTAFGAFMAMIIYGLPLVGSIWGIE